MNRALILLFVMIIALPLVGTLAGVDGGDREAENRELAAFPHWEHTWTSTQAYPGALTAWFEDHFAFRADFVRWYAESRFFGLGVSPSSAVLKGKDHWLYYAEDGGVVDYANATPLTPGEVGAWREALERARDWLHHRRIAFVFTIAPDKHVIYPEYVPSTIRVVHTASRTDQIYAALAPSGVSTVELRPALLAAKPRERLFFFTDTHWNDRGALIAYQQIIDAVRAQVPATPPAWTREDFEATEEEIPGKDLAGMIGLKRVLRELDLRLLPKRQRRARVVDPPGGQITSEVGRLVTEIADPSLPRAVVFRDSFATRVVPFLSEHFSRAVYLWQNDFDASVVSDEHPDVVIEEIVGRHLYEFIASPELVPK
jgi:alginate O-acetyltransferase complex protein AlgJ